MRMTRMSTLGKRFAAPEITPASLLQAEEWQREQERQQARQLWRDHLRDSGIPKRYQRASLKACPPEVRQYVEGFTGDTTKWLVLCGDCGTGKTTAACAAAIQIARICTVRFVVSPDFVATASDFKTSREADAYRTCRLLVLDDVGKERGTETATSAVYSLLNARYNACKPTIITTNLNARRLSEHFAREFGKEMAHALVSRSSEDSVLVEMNGADWRLQKPR